MRMSPRGQYGWITTMANLYTMRALRRLLLTFSVSLPQPVFVNKNLPQTDGVSAPFVRPFGS